MRMASERVRSTVKHDLVADINAVSIFGRCKREDLEFESDEERERARKFNEERRRKEEEIRKQEEKRKAETEAYEHYFRQQTERVPVATKRITTYGNPPRGVGRARSLMDFPRPTEKKPGHPSQEIGCLPLNQRAERVRENIQQFCGDPAIHSNSTVKEVWVKKNGVGIEDGESDDDQIYVSDSTVSDQYENAESSAASLEPYISAPSDTCESPAVSVPLPSLDPPPCTQEAVHSTHKPRRSRLAARFNFENDEEEDPLAILGSSRPPAVAVKYTASRRIRTGTSFNSLRPSQRVLSNDVLLPEDLVRTSAGGNFTYKADDFPPL